MEQSNHHMKRFALILVLVAFLSACSKLQVEPQQAIDQTPSEPSTFTTTPFPEPISTRSPTPTLAPIVFESLSVLSAQNMNQLTMLSRFDRNAALQFVWAKDSQSIFALEGGSVQHIDLRSSEEIALLPIVPEDAEIQFCSAQSLMMASFDETQREDGYELQIWDLETGQQRHTFTREDRAILATSHPQFSQDCSLLAVASTGSPIYPSLFEVFDLASGDKVYQTTDPYPIARAMAVHGSSQRLATGTGAGIFLWDLGGIEPWGKISLEVSDGRIDGFDLLGQALALPAVGPPQVELWDLQEMQPFARFEGSFAAFSPDGAMLLTFDKDGFTLWDISSGENLANFPAAASLHISPDQSMLLVTYGPGSFENIVEVWGVPEE